MQNCLYNVFLYSFVFLATSLILGYSTRAGPVNSVADEDGVEVVEDFSNNQTIPTTDWEYPELKRSTRRRIEFRMRSLVRRNPVPIPLKFWDREFDNRDEACAEVDAYMQTVEENACRTGYVCDYDEGRWPSTLITLNCSHWAPCKARTYGGNPRDTCMKSERYITVAKFKRDEQQHGPGVTGHQPANSQNELRGKWGTAVLTMTEKCFCKQ